MAVTFFNRGQTSLVALTGKKDVPSLPTDRRQEWPVHAATNPKLLAERVHNQRGSFLRRIGVKAAASTIVTPAQNRKESVDSQPSSINAGSPIYALAKHRMESVSSLHLPADAEVIGNMNEDLPSDKKGFNNFQKKLRKTVTKHIRSTTNLSRKKAKHLAKQKLRDANTLALSKKEWEPIKRNFVHEENFYQSRLIPACQIKSGDQSIFEQPYKDKQGFHSGSTTQTVHAPNLWTSTFIGSKLAVDDTPQVLFQGVRHSGLCPYGVKDDTERATGARNRAKEVATAALSLQPGKLQKAIDGEIVDLQLTSTSLLSAFNFSGMWEEGKHFDSQLEAWRSLSNLEQQPCVLTVHDANGKPHQIKVNLQVAAFNFGVNEIAMQTKAGWKKSDAANEAGFKQLFGENLKPLTSTEKDGGWVGKYLENLPKPLTEEMAAKEKRIQQLSQQIRYIWKKKLHHKDKGDPYKLAQRIALLSHEINAVPCYNCKSSKDRTGWLDSEIKREAANLHATSRLSPIGMLGHEQKSLFRKVLKYSGNLEIQHLNTGGEGNKVIKNSSPLQRAMRATLSLKERIGDKDEANKIRGVSWAVSS